MRWQPCHRCHWLKAPPCERRLVLYLGELATEQYLLVSGVPGLRCRPRLARRVQPKHRQEPREGDPVVPNRGE
jgi:hypothetical protein